MTNLLSLPPLELVVPESGAWFSVNAGARIDLTKKRNLRSALLQLLDARARNPGVPVHWRRMVAGIWVGELIGDAAARNRLRVTVSDLRRLGLRPVLLSDHRGYRLDPRCAVRIVQGYGELPAAPRAPRRSHRGAGRCPSIRGRCGGAFVALAESA